MPNPYLEANPDSPEDALAACLDAWPLLLDNPFLDLSKAVAGELDAWFNKLSKLITDGKPYSTVKTSEEILTHAAVRPGWHTSFTMWYIDLLTCVAMEAPSRDRRRAEQQLVVTELKPEFDVDGLTAAIRGDLKPIVTFGWSKIFIDEEFVRVQIHWDPNPTKRMIRFMDEAGYEVVLSNSLYSQQDFMEYWWRLKRDHFHHWHQ